MKVLWIDFEDRFYIMSSTIKHLLREGFEVKEFYWYNLEIGGLDIRGAVEAAKEVDIVMVHFSDIPRGEAAKLLAQIKATKVKVIVNSASPILFEEADAVIGLPFYPSDLVELIKDVCAKKDQSQQ